MMKFKKYLVGISMILASAAACAKPNAMTLDGSFINNTSSSVGGVVFANDYSDNVYIKISGVPMSPSDTSSGAFDVVSGIGVTYSIELSSLKSYITMRLVNMNTHPYQMCDWHVDKNTSTANPPVLTYGSEPACTLTGAYNFEMRKL